MTAFDRVWASDLTDEQVASEYVRVSGLMKSGFSDCSGSPCEWLYERIEELQVSAKKRGIPLPELICA